MVFGQDRNDLRRFYFESWRKARNSEPLEDLERLVAEIIRQHPEYQPLLEDEEQALGREFPPELGESNPFLHMGMHIAIQEQIQVNRPQGISAAYHQVVMSIGDAHAAEHKIMECLAETLWQAQRSGTPADEQAYLRSVQKLSAKGK